MDTEIVKCLILQWVYSSFKYFSTVKIYFNKKKNTLDLQNIKCLIKISFKITQAHKLLRVLHYHNEL